MGADIACAIKEVFAVTPAAGSVRYPGFSCGLARFGVGSLGVVVFFFLFLLLRRILVSFR